MDVLRCSAAREWARRVVGRWWSGDLSGLLDAGGGGEVGDGDGLVAVGAWRAWPEATTAVPQTGQVVVTLSSRTGAAAGAGGAQPVGVGAGGDDQRVERQAVDDRSGQARVGEGLAPLAERGIAGHRDGGFLLAFGDDLEQQLRAARVEVEVAELVDLCRRRHRSTTSACYRSAPTPPKASTAWSTP